MKKILLSVIIIAAILISGFYILNNYIYQQKQADSQVNIIDSFEDCVAAGYPVMESYPEQCRTADGRNFVRDISKDVVMDNAREIIIQGKFVCLPHLNTDGPQTLECAFGLLSDEGDYYALHDSDPMYGNISSVPGGSHVKVSGVFTPGGSSKYQDIGIITVETVEVLE